MAWKFLYQIQTYPVRFLAAGEVDVVDNDRTAALLPPPPRNRIACDRIAVVVKVYIITF
jgi:hypothetical protein